MKFVIIIVDNIIKGVECRWNRWYRNRSIFLWQCVLLIYRHAWYNILMDFINTLIYKNFFIHQFERWFNFRLWFSFRRENCCIDWAKESSWFFQRSWFGQNDTWNRSSVFFARKFVSSFDWIQRTRVNLSNSQYLDFCTHISLFLLILNARI